jgi:serine/threonine-protein kinase HipA
MMKKCLFCYGPIPSDWEYELHQTCSRQLFGSRVPIEIHVDLADIRALAMNYLEDRKSITGIQPKFGLGIDRTLVTSKKSRKILQHPVTILGGMADIPGDYIFKPPSEEFPSLPEVEDLCMHLSQICRISTATHSLIRLRSGELAYICRRFDRINGEKLAQEDMAQLTGVMTENKYHSSMEKVGKAVRSYTSNPGVEVIKFYDLTIFSFLTGNSDMHLKNFSILTEKDGVRRLTPAYDLIAVPLVYPADKEELALPLNGKKKNLRPKDFLQFALTIGIPEKIARGRIDRFRKFEPAVLEFIDRSFLTAEMQQQLKKLYTERLVRITQNNQ